MRGAVLDQEVVKAPLLPPEEDQVESFATSQEVAI